MTFLKMLWEQKGLCIITHKILTINGIMQMSPERINEKKGYVKGNICLISLLFQSSSHGNNKNAIYSIGSEIQWSRGKYLSIPFEIKKASMDIDSLHVYYSLHWKLTGDRFDVMGANNKAVLSADKKFKGLKALINNYIKYYK